MWTYQCHVIDRHYEWHNSFFECRGWPGSWPALHSKKGGNQLRDWWLPPTVDVTYRESIFRIEWPLLFAMTSLSKPTCTPSVFSISGRGVSPSGWRTCSRQIHLISRGWGSLGWNLRCKKTWLWASACFCLWSCSFSLVLSYMLYALAFASALSKRGILKYAMHE